MLEYCLWLRVRWVEFWTIKLCNKTYVSKHSSHPIQILPKYSSHPISATAYTVIQSQLQPKYICHPN